MFKRPSQLNQPLVTLKQEDIEKYTTHYYEQWQKFRKLLQNIHTEYKGYYGPEKTTQDGNDYYIGSQLSYKAWLQIDERILKIEPKAPHRFSLDVQSLAQIYQLTNELTFLMFAGRIFHKINSLQTTDCISKEQIIYYENIIFSNVPRNDGNSIPLSILKENIPFNNQSHQNAGLRITGNDDTRSQKSTYSNYSNFSLINRQSGEETKVLKQWFGDDDANKIILSIKAINGMTGNEKFKELVTTEKENLKELIEQRIKFYINAQKRELTDNQNKALGFKNATGVCKVALKIFSDIKYMQDPELHKHFQTQLTEINQSLNQLVHGLQKDEQEQIIAMLNPQKQQSVVTQQLQK